MEDKNNEQGRPVPQTGLRAAGSSPHQFISTGPNERPRNETIAGTGPGIPDEAMGPGEELPEQPSDEEVRRAAEQLGAPIDRR
jgi:hypothetical protein